MACRDGDVACGDQIFGIVECEAVVYWPARPLAGGRLPAGFSSLRVEPYKIVHAFEEHVQCAVCGFSFEVIGKHLKQRHEMTGDEYRQEFGPEREVSSESFRATKFEGHPIAGIEHWERIWSRHYVTDWILRLHEEGHALNIYNYEHIGTTLARCWILHFGSWDAASRSAGLNPEQFRAVPPNRQWNRTMVIESLRNFARLKQENKKREMSNPLRMAITRFFHTPKAACKAAGIEYVEINYRAIFEGERLIKLVAAIRSLENLQGRESCRRLDAIYNKNQLNQRIINRGSPRGLTFGGFMGVLISERSRFPGSCFLSVRFHPARQEINRDRGKPERWLLASSGPDK